MAKKKPKEPKKEKPPKFAPLRWTEASGVEWGFNGVGNVGNNGFSAYEAETIRGPVFIFEFHVVPGGPESFRAISIPIMIEPWDGTAAVVTFNEGTTLAQVKQEAQESHEREVMRRNAEVSRWLA